MNLYSVDFCCVCLEKDLRITASLMTYNCTVILPVLKTAAQKYTNSRSVHKCIQNKSKPLSIQSCRCTKICTHR